MEDDIWWLPLLGPSIIGETFSHLSLKDLSITIMENPSLRVEAI